MLKEIYKRLGIGTTLEEEKSRFYVRIDLILNKLENYLLGDPRSEEVIRQISFKLGEYERHSFTAYLTSRTFKEFLGVCEIILEFFSRYFHGAYITFKRSIQKALDESVIDLGITFKNDKFIPTGAKELDEKLLLEPLEWLKDFPIVKKSFERALGQLLKKEYADSITNAYSSLESMVKTFLNRKARLDKLIPDLLRELKLLGDWSGILGHYCQYAHEFSSRHGKKDTGVIEPPNPIHVEAYIYMTGLVLRLIIQEINRNK